MIPNPFETILQKLELIDSKFSATQLQSQPTAIEIIDRKELCKRLRITEPTAMIWDKKGKIPSFRIGSAFRYNWPSVIEHLEGKKKGGAVK